jgi:hypothetical protein
MLETDGRAAMPLFRKSAEHLAKTSDGCCCVGGAVCPIGVGVEV